MARLLERGSRLLRIYMSELQVVLMAILLFFSLPFSRTFVHFCFCRNPTLVSEKYPFMPLLLLLSSSSATERLPFSFYFIVKFSFPVQGHRRGVLGTSSQFCYFSSRGDFSLFIHSCVYSFVLMVCNYSDFQCLVYSSQCLKSLSVSGKWRGTITVIYQFTRIEEF